MKTLFRYNNMHCSLVEMQHCKRNKLKLKVNQSWVFSPEPDLENVEGVPPTTTKAIQVSSLKNRKPDMQLKAPMHMQKWLNSKRTSSALYITETHIHTWVCQLLTKRIENYNQVALLTVQYAINIVMKWAIMERKQWEQNALFLYIMYCE